MKDALAIILMRFVDLCEGNANAIEQVLMLDVEGMSEPEKAKRRGILATIRITQQGCGETLKRIEAWTKKKGSTA